jgi:type II secretory pathway component PulJ
MKVALVSARAFTLVEILIAMALLTALLGAIFAFGFDMLNSRARVLDIAWRQRAATALIERLEMDLMAAVASDSGVAGIRGDETRLSILTRGVASSLAERPRGRDDAEVFGDLQLADYRFDQVRHTLEARRTQFDASDATGGVAFAPIGNMARVRFRYRVGDQWAASFDSAVAGRRPRAVEVAVWFESSGGESPNSKGPKSKGHVLGRLDFDHLDFDHLDSARQAMNEPSPDRVRVILIPDSDADEGSGLRDQGTEIRERDAAADPLSLTPDPSVVEAL